MCVEEGLWSTHWVMKTVCYVFCVVGVVAADRSAPPGQKEAGGTPSSPVAAVAASGASAPSGAGPLGRAASDPTDIVVLLDNMKPLPKATVMQIQQGKFVDFCRFPEVNDGPSDEGIGEPPGAPEGASSKRRLKEVPNFAVWGACLNLFIAAWCQTDPEMLRPLLCYREVIHRLTMSHPWSVVARYDRAFRQRAAGKKNVSWSVPDVGLTWSLREHAAQSGDEKWNYVGQEECFQD